MRKHPLADGVTAWTALAVAYLALFSAYWLAALVGSWPGRAGLGMLDLQTDRLAWLLRSCCLLQLPAPLLVLEP